MYKAKRFLEFPPISRDLATRPENTDSMALVTSHLPVLGIKMRTMQNDELSNNTTSTQLLLNGATKL